LVNRSLCCSRIHLDLCTLQWPELQLDLSGQQEPVRFLEVSILLGPELHLNMIGQQEPVLIQEMSTPQGPALHLDVLVSTLQRCDAPRFVYAAET
jgi:hypothetical protein